MDNKFQPQYDDGSQFMLQPEHDASVKPRPVYMFRPDGTPTDLMSSVLVGDYGQRRGYTPARDEGVLKEFGKGLVRGTAEFGQGVAKTFDATEQAAGIEFFLSTNRQLADSESKGVWSYIANVAGAQIAQNAPMMLATLGAGAAVGAAGKGAMAAAKTAAAGMSLQEGGALVAKTAAGIAAKKLVAAKAAGMASTFIMENGGDLQELRERLPDVPDEQRVAMAFGLSLFKAWVEVGWGVSADTAKAISRWGLGRALAQGGTLTGLQKLVGPRWMGSIGGSVIGKWARTGAEETFEELIQKSGTEALVAFNRGASYDKGAGELFREYSQVLREGLIGGLALGVLPTTMNAITEAQIRQKRNRITGNSDAARESLDSGQPIDGVRRYDQAKVSKTNQVFADLYAALGHKFEEDPGKRTRPVDTLVHLCYNIANEAATNETDPSKRDTIRPENYIKDLSVLLMSNTDEGRAAAAVLNDALDKAERSENGGQIILDAISQVHKDTGIGIVSVMETAQLRRLEAEQDMVRRETMKQVLGDENAELDELRKLADEAGASIRSKYGTQQELRVAGTVVVRDRRMSEMLASLGDKARAVYAFGWITGIKIGDRTKAIKITRNRATGGFYGEIYDQARADELLKNQELSPAGRSKISTVTGEALAIAKARTLELGRIRSRWDGYTVVPRPLVQQTTPEPVVAEPKSPADATDAARVAATQAQVDAELEAQDAADAQVSRAKALINFAQAIKQELAELPIEDVIERKRVNDFVERYKDVQIPKAEDAKTDEERTATEQARGTLAEQIADVEAILRKNIEAIRLEKGAAKYFNQFLPKSMRVRVQYEKAESSEASAKTIEEPLTGERRGAYLGKKNTFLQQYDSLMMLFPNHDAATVLHELVHHMVENALMPESIRKVFWEQYAKSALGTKEPAAQDYDLMALPDGAQENIANTLLAFIMENKISGATPAMTKAYTTLRAIIQASVINGKRSLNFIVDDADGSMRQVDGTPLALKDDTKAMLKALIMSPVTPDKLVKIYGDALANSVELGMESGMYDSVVTSERMALLGQQLGMTSENLQKMLATKYGEKVKDPVVLMNIVDAELRDAMPGADVKRVSVRYERAARSPADAKHADLESRAKLGDMDAFKKAGEMVDGAALRAGAIPEIVWRGDAQKITVFDVSKRGSRTGAPSAREAFFFTTDKTAAEGYEKQGSFVRTTHGEHDLSELMALITRLPDMVADAYNKYWGNRGENRVTPEDVLDESYFFLNWMYSDDPHKGLGVDWIDWKKVPTGEKFAIELKNENVWYPGYTGAYRLLITNPMIHDFGGAPRTFGTDESFAEIIKKAKEDGRDGVIFKNTYDRYDGVEGPVMDVFAVFDPSKIKEAAAFTYDDKGNLIPLSKRFDSGKVDVRYEARRANRKRGGVLPSVAQGKSAAELGEWAKTAKIVSAAVVGSNGKIYPDVKAKGFKPMGHVQAVMAAAMDGAEPLADGVVTSEGQFASRTMAGAITGHLVGEGWDSSMMARKPDVEIGGEAWQKYLNDAYRRESVGGTPVTVHVRNEIGYHGTQEVRNERVGRPQTDFSGMTRKDLTNRVRQLFADSAGRVDRSAIKALVTSMYGDRSTDKHPTGVSQLSDSEIMALIMAREDEVSQEETEPDLPEYTAELAAAVNEGAVRNLQELADRSMFDKAAGLLARGWRGLISNIADFYTFCNLLACGDENSKWREISDKVRQVNNNEAAERGRVSDALFFELAEAAGQIELDDIMFGTFEVVDGEGRRRLVRNTDAMEVWVLAEGGSNLESVEIQKLLLSNPAKSPNGYDAKMVAAMVGHVNGSAALKKVVAITQKYANAAFEKASGVYYNVTGKTAKMVSGLYSPGEYEGQSYDPGEPSLPFLDNANRGSPLDPTERKEFKHKRRSAGASRNTDYFSKMVKHINALNMYANKAEVINELLAAVESDVMRDVFIDKFGDAALRDKMVQLLLREMAPAGNMRRYSPAERMANDVSRNLVTSALGWNPFSMLTQPVTVGPVMSILGVKSAPRLVANIAKSISEWAGSGLNFVDTDMYKRIKRLSPAVLIESKREPGHERLVTLLENSGVGALRMHNKVLINMRHLGMKPMAGMDLFVRLATWETAFEQKYEELSRLTGQYTHAQMEERAAAFAEDVILKSHNPTTASEKGLWQTESSALMRSLFAFQSQPFANMKAFLIDGVLPVLQAYQRDGMPGMVRKLASDSTLYRKLMFGAFLPGLALGMLGRRRPQKNLEEVLSDAIWLGLGSMVPVLGGAVWWKSITGFSGSSSFNSLFTQYIDSIANTVGGLTGQRTAMETIPDAIRVIEGLTGIPDYPVKIARKMLEGVIVDGGPHSGRALIDLIKESTGTKPQD